MSFPLFIFFKYKHIFLYFCLFLCCLLLVSYNNELITDSVPSHNDNKNKFLLLHKINSSGLFRFPLRMSHFSAKVSDRKLWNLNRSFKLFTRFTIFFSELQICSTRRKIWYNENSKEKIKKICGLENHINLSLVEKSFEQNFNLYGN